MLRYRNRVTCAMKDANNHDSVAHGLIVNGIRPVEGDAQSACELRARRAGEGEMA